MMSVAQTTAQAASQLVEQAASQLIEQADPQPSDQATYQPIDQAASQGDEEEDSMLESSMTSIDDDSTDAEKDNDFCLSCNINDKVITALKTSCNIKDHVITTLNAQLATTLTAEQELANLLLIRQERYKKRERYFHKLLAKKDAEIVKRRMNENKKDINGLLSLKDKKIRRLVKVLQQKDIANERLTLKLKSKRKFTLPDGSRKTDNDGEPLKIAVVRGKRIRI